MPLRHDAPSPEQETPNDRRGTEAFVRRSHMFASVVREILETAPLRAATPDRLSTAQFLLLKLMSLDGALPIGRVADAMGITPPAATKNADKLERLGLAVRSSSPVDRRERLLFISAKGRRLVEDCERLKAERLRAAIEGFTAEEIDRLSEFLERLTVSLLTPGTTERGSCLRCSACLSRNCSVGRLLGGCPHAALAREVS